MNLNQSSLEPGSAWGCLSATENFLIQFYNKNSVSSIDQPWIFSTLKGSKFQKLNAGEGLEWKQLLQLWPLSRYKHIYMHVRFLSKLIFLLFLSPSSLESLSNLTFLSLLWVVNRYRHSVIKFKFPNPHLINRTFLFNMWRLASSTW